MHWPHGLSALVVVVAGVVAGATAAAVDDAAPTPADVELSPCCAALVLSRRVEMAVEARRAAGRNTSVHEPHLFARMERHVDEQCAGVADVRDECGAHVKRATESCDGWRAGVSNRAFQALVPDLLIFGAQWQAGPVTGGYELVFDLSTNEFGVFDYMGAYANIGWESAVGAVLGAAAGAGLSAGDLERFEEMATAGAVGGFLGGIAIRTTLSGAVGAYAGFGVKGEANRLSTLGEAYSASFYSAGYEHSVLPGVPFFKALTLGATLSVGGQGGFDFDLASQMDKLARGDYSSMLPQLAENGCWSFTVSLGAGCSCPAGPLGCVLPRCARPDPDDLTGNVFAQATNYAMGERVVFEDDADLLAFAARLPIFGQSAAMPLLAAHALLKCERFEPLIKDGALHSQDIAFVDR